MVIGAASMGSICHAGVSEKTSSYLINQINKVEIEARGVIKWFDDLFNKQVRFDKQVDELGRMRQQAKTLADGMSQYASHLDGDDRELVKKALTIAMHLEQMLGEIHRQLNEIKGSKNQLVYIKTFQSIQQLVENELKKLDAMLTSLYYSSKHMNASCTEHIRILRTNLIQLGSNVSAPSKGVVLRRANDFCA